MTRRLFVEWALFRELRSGRNANFVDHAPKRTALHVQIIHLSFQLAVLIQGPLNHFFEMSDSDYELLLLPVTLVQTTLHLLIPCLVDIFIRTEALAGTLLAQSRNVVAEMAYVRVTLLSWRLILETSCLTSMTG